MVCRGGVGLNGLGRHCTSEAFETDHAHGVKWFAAERATLGMRVYARMHAHAHTPSRVHAPFSTEAKRPLRGSQFSTRISKNPTLLHPPTPPPLVPPVPVPHPLETLSSSSPQPPTATLATPTLLQPAPPATPLHPQTPPPSRLPAPAARPRAPSPPPSSSPTPLHPHPPPPPQARAPAARPRPRHHHQRATPAAASCRSTLGGCTGRCTSTGAWGRWMPSGHTTLNRGGCRWGLSEMGCGSKHTLFSVPPHRTLACSTGRSHGPVSAGLCQRSSHATAR